jgi:hypothetical protein
MTSPAYEARAARTVALAVLSWGCVAAALAATGLTSTLEGTTAIAVAAFLLAAATGAYALDEELRAAARATPRRRILAWALAFDAAAVATMALAGTNPGPWPQAMWVGLAALGPAFAWPLSAAFHLAALDGTRSRAIRLSAPGTSPERSPAGT